MFNADAPTITSESLAKMLEDDTAAAAAATLEDSSVNKLDFVSMASVLIESLAAVRLLVMVILTIASALTASSAKIFVRCRTLVAAMTCCELVMVMAMMAAPMTATKLDDDDAVHFMIHSKKLRFVVGNARRSIAQCECRCEQFRFLTIRT